MRAKSSTCSLEASLKAYSAGAESACWSRSERFRKWSIYAAATGSALAMATSADASIITGYSGVTLTATRVSSSTFARATAVDFGSSRGLLRLMANWRHIVHSSGASSTATSYNSASVLLGGRHGAGVLVNSTGGLRRLNFGDLISSGMPGYGSATGGVAKNCGCALYGEFASGVTGFAAFELYGGEYGWIQLRWDSTLHDGYPDQITALSWGYEDVAGVPIAAGVPEPGTLALSALAMGAMGVLAMRRRRKQTAPAEPQ